MEKYITEIRPGRKPLKRGLVKAIFWFLGRGFQAAAAFDTYVQAEVEHWRDGMTITFEVGPTGIAMSVGRREGRLVFLGLKKEPEAEIVITFKNIEAALLVLTGQVGIAEAFAGHRFVMRGDLALGMSLVRCLNIVEAYLFPSFITKKILKQQPARSSNSLVVYLGTLVGSKQRRRVGCYQNTMNSKTLSK